MLTRAPGKTAKPAPDSTPTAAPSSIDALVRRLVAEAKTPAPVRRGPLPAGRPSANDAPVLLDTEVDGVRCVLLVRAAQEPSPPRPSPAQATPSRSPMGAEAPVRATSLSPREQEIVRMVAQGYPNKVIADVLEISTWTVGTHLRRIFAKLAVTSRAAMVARIMEQGLLGR